MDSMVALFIGLRMHSVCEIDFLKNLLMDLLVGIVYFAVNS